jgi:hypothetical protein
MTITPKILFPKERPAMVIPVDLEVPAWMVPSEEMANEPASVVLMHRETGRLEILSQSLLMSLSFDCIMDITISYESIGFL